MIPSDPFDPIRDFRLSAWLAALRFLGEGRVRELLSAPPLLMPLRTERRVLLGLPAKRVDSVTALLAIAADEGSSYADYRQLDQATVVFDRAIVKADIVQLLEGDRPADCRLFDRLRVLLPHRAHIAAEARVFLEDLLREYWFIRHDWSDATAAYQQVGLHVLLTLVFGFDLCGTLRDDIIDRFCEVLEGRFAPPHALAEYAYVLVGQGWGVP